MPLDRPSPGVRCRARERPQDRFLGDARGGRCQDASSRAARRQETRGGGAARATALASVGPGEGPGGPAGALHHGRRLRYNL